MFLLAWRLIHIVRCSVEIISKKLKVILKSGVLVRKSFG